MKKISNLVLISMLTMLTACGGGAGGMGVVPVSTLPTMVNGGSNSGSNTDPSNTDPSNTDPTDPSNTDPSNTDPTNPSNTDPSNTNPSNPTVPTETIEIKRQEIIAALNSTFSNDLNGTTITTDNIRAGTPLHYGSGMTNIAFGNTTNRNNIYLKGEQIGLSYSDFGVWEKRDYNNVTGKYDVTYKPIHVVREDKSQTFLGPQEREDMTFRGKAYAVVNNNNPEIKGNEAHYQTVIPGSAELRISNIDNTVNYFKAKETYNFSFDNWYNMEFENEAAVGRFTVKNVEKRNDYIERDNINGTYSNLDTIDNKYQNVSIRRDFAGVVERDPDSPSGYNYGRTEDVTGNIHITYDQRPVDISFGAKRVD